MRVVPATLFVLMTWCEPLAAGEYSVEISGAAGTTFGGTCLSVVADRTASHDASGIVPLTLELTADQISCAIQKKAGAGELHLVIKGADGHVVAQSAAIQPFGVVMAAGR